MLCELRKFFFNEVCKTWSERRLDDADFICHFSYSICIACGYLSCYSSAINFEHTSRCRIRAGQAAAVVLARERWAASRKVSFSCSSFSKFSSSIFFQKAVVFLVHEKGESERERGSNFFLFLFVPQSRRSLKISWRSFFRSITVSFPKCASDERSVKILFLWGGGWGWVSVVCRLGHSGVRSRDRQLGFVTTVSPNCLVSNHWVFWVVY